VSLKIEVARRQLGTALFLYLRDFDPVSVHCLASAGCEVIEHFAKKVGREPFMMQVQQQNPNLPFEELRGMQRRYWNAFKHATERKGVERQDNEILANFTDEQNDVALLIGWHDYHMATKKIPMEAQTHMAWYITLHPEKLNPGHELERYTRYFSAEIKNKSRSMQKAELRSVIERTRSVHEIMGHAETDTRGLMIGWPPRA
jgi:hypothetical protein